MLLMTKLYPPGSDLTDAYAVRTSVFVNEQGFSPELETDEIDHTAYHIVLFDGSKPVATGRVFPDTEDKQTYFIGRVAVLRRYRGQGAGIKLMSKLEECVKTLGGARVVLGAQNRAMDFYRKCGYTPFGAEYLDEDCPHTHMEKTL
jgi:predicted GNAT family N-acyltransferase